MKRNNTTTDLITLNNQQLNRQIAYHEAGHAAAIYLRNQQLNLPPVFFQIKFKTPSELTVENASKQCKNALIDDDAAVIEGGCLVHSLPVSLIESCNYFSTEEQDAYFKAISADIINLLVGPLSEAKFTAIRDDEWIDSRLDNIDVLSHYGGASDINKINEYLDSFIAAKKQRAELMSSSIRQAFEFINSAKNWSAITQLAQYIEHRTSDTITCEQIIGVIEHSFKQWQQAKTNRLSFSSAAL